MTNISIRGRAAEEAAFIHHLARMIFELKETQVIVSEWNRFAEQMRARAPGDATVERELVSVFVGILDESRRMAAAHVASTAAELADALAELRRRLEETSKDLESQDRLGNFEIQDLMSQYNQAETLLSSVMKKRDEASSSVIQKIG